MGIVWRLRGPGQARRGRERLGPRGGRGPTRAVRHADAGCGGAGVEGWGRRPVYSDRIGPEPACDGGHCPPLARRTHAHARSKGKISTALRQTGPPRSGLVQRWRAEPQARGPATFELAHVVRRAFGGSSPWLGERPRHHLVPGWRDSSSCSKQRHPRQMYSSTSVVLP